MDFAWLRAGIYYRPMSSLPVIDELNGRFSIPDIAELVSGQGGLPKLNITTPASAAEIYLHGAHLTSWRPAGLGEVIFLSKHSQWQEGRAIRGGVPVCFPWFRNKADNPKAPSHGFARTRSWQLASVTQAEGSVTVTLSTESEDATRQWWPHDFRLLHRITIGKELTMELVVTNTGSTPLQFEEALHTYFKVGEAERVRVAGLDGVAFLDNMDANREKVQHGDVVVPQPTDNIYLDTRHALELIDPVLARHIQTEKKNSLTTVIWNPGAAGAKALADLGDDEWHQMTCVEASNIRAFAVDLAPGAEHAMSATIKVIAAQQ